MVVTSNLPSNAAIQQEIDPVFKSSNRPRAYKPRPSGRAKAVPYIIKNEAASGCTPEKTSSTPIRSRSPWTRRRTSYTRTPSTPVYNHRNPMYALTEAPIPKPEYLNFLQATNPIDWSKPNPLNLKYPNDYPNPFDFFPHLLGTKPAYTSSNADAGAFKSSPLTKPAATSYVGTTHPVTPVHTKKAHPAQVEPPKKYSQKEAYEQLRALNAENLLHMDLAILDQIPILDEEDEKNARESMKQYFPLELFPEIKILF